MDAKSVYDALRNSGVLYLFKDILMDISGFINVMKVAPGMTMRMAFSNSLLAEMGKGLAKGLATMVVSFVANEIEKWIESQNQELINEMKKLDSGKNIIPFNYLNSVK